MPSAQKLNHLAVIMDGNGRWAEKQNHKRLFGHVQGAKTTRWLIQHCSQMKLPFLSLFALSAENIYRPAKEIQSLKKLLEKAFLKHSDLLMKEKNPVEYFRRSVPFSPFFAKNKPKAL